MPSVGSVRKDLNPKPRRHSMARRLCATRRTAGGSVRTSFNTSPTRCRRASLIVAPRPMSTCSCSRSRSGTTSTPRPSKKSHARRHPQQAKRLTIPTIEAPGLCRKETARLRLDGFERHTTRSIFLGSWTVGRGGKRRDGSSSDAINPDRTRKPHCCIALRSSAMARGDVNVRSSLVLRHVRNNGPE